MSMERGTFAGATAIGASSHEFSASAADGRKYDPALRHWLTGSTHDEHTVNDTRRAVSEFLQAAFPGEDSDWLVTASTAILNGISTSEVLNIETYNWKIDPSDEIAEAVRFSLLWLASLEGNVTAFGLLARLLRNPTKLSMSDRMAGLRTIADVAAMFADGVSVEINIPADDPDRIEIYDADLIGAQNITPYFDLPTLLATKEPDTVICATRDSLETAEGQLRPNFPWMEDASQTLFRSQYLRVLEGAAPYRFPPTLLLGPSGTAKTSFAYALAEQVGLPVFYVSAAGKTGSLEIVGSSRSYQEASPSVGVRAMRQHQCRNPIIVVDEVDKFGQSLQNGDPYGALATMVESHTARAYMDDFLEAPVDLSLISWIFTANAIEPLKGPFLDRLEILRIQRPTIDHFPAIYGHALREIARDAGISESSLPELSPSVVKAIRDSFRTGISLRRVKSAIAKSLEIAARHQSN